MDAKDLYVTKISNNSEDHYGSELLKMMNYYNVNNLRELTLLEVKEYYMHIMRGSTD